MSTLFQINVPVPSSSVAGARSYLASVEADAIAAAGVDSDALEIFQRLAQDGDIRGARRALFQLDLPAWEEQQAGDHLEAIRSAWLVLNMAETKALRSLKP